MYIKLGCSETIGLRPMATSKYIELCVRFKLNWDLAIINFRSIKYSITKLNANV